MKAWEGIVEAVAAALGVAITLLTLGRRSFHKAVQDVVAGSMADLDKRLERIEKRQGQHLDRQDKRLARIERKLSQPQRLRDRPQPDVSTSGSTGGPAGTSYQGSSSGVARR